MKHEAGQSRQRAQRCGDAAVRRRRELVVRQLDVCQLDKAQRQRIQSWDLRSNDSIAQRVVSVYELVLSYIICRPLSIIIITTAWALDKTKTVRAKASCLLRQQLDGAGDICPGLLALKPQVQVVQAAELLGGLTERCCCWRRSLPHSVSSSVCPPECTTLQDEMQGDTHKSITALDHRLVPPSGHEQGHPAIGRFR